MKRCLICFLIYVLAGLSVTVAVAWLLAAFVEVPMYPRTLGRVWIADDGGVWSSGEVTRIGVTDIWWDSANASYPTFSVDQQLATIQEMHDQLLRDRDYFRALRTPPDFGTMANGLVPESSLIGSDTAYGLPLRCLWFTVVGDLQGNTLLNARLAGGYRLTGTLSARGLDFRALPIWPIWSGLLVNTLFYATLLLVLTQGLLLMRRRVRRRRGQCPWCAYPLSGANVCAECGKTQPDRTPAPGSE